MSSTTDKVKAVPIESPARLSMASVKGLTMRLPRARARSRTPRPPKCWQSSKVY